MKNFKATSTSTTVFSKNMNHSDTKNNSESINGMFDADKYMDNGTDLNTITNPGIYKAEDDRTYVPFELNSTVFLLVEFNKMEKWMKKYLVMRRYSNTDENHNMCLIVLTVNAVLYTNTGWFILPKENTDAMIDGDSEL